MNEEFEKLFVLRSPPVLLTESQKDYDDFVAHLTEELDPKDIFDKLNIRDAAEGAWHIRRLRCSRPSIINMSFRKAIVQFLFGSWERIKRSKPRYWLIGGLLPKKSKLNLLRY